MFLDFQYQILTAVSWLIYALLPVYLLITLWRYKEANFWSWLIKAALCGSCILMLFLIGVWPFVCGYWIREFLVFSFVIIATKSFFNTKRDFAIKYCGIKPLLASVVNIAVLTLMVWHSIGAMQGSVLRESSVSLTFPLKQGRFYIVHGGGNEVINHHYSISAQKFALDLVALTPWGFSARGVMSGNLNDYLIYGAPLYSPCTGTIIEATGVYPDLNPFHMDPENPAGNFLAIAMDKSDAIIILAHLQQGSLEVKSGDRVIAGQRIAKVGNSGNTTEPHLHIHAIRKDTGSFLFTGEGLPITFEDQFFSRNALVSVSDEGLIHLSGLFNLAPEYNKTKLDMRLKN